MIETLTAESFDPHLNTGFAISIDGHDEMLTLVSVERYKSVMEGAARAPFSLIFHGARTDARFNDNIMALDHPAMGVFDLFLAPIGQNPNGTFRYQAVFT